MTAPRISVRTRGLKEWSIRVHNLATAEAVRKKFRQSGLLCSHIGRDDTEFVFTVDGDNVPASTGDGVATPTLLFG